MLTTPALIVTDETNEFEDFNLGKEIAKDIVLSSAQTAGVAAGFVVVAFACAGALSLRDRFFKKTELATVHNITSLPKTDN